MKNCTSIENKITAYQHGELNEPDIQAVESHLENCKACRAELAAQRQTLELLGETLESASAPEQLNPWGLLTQRRIRPQNAFLKFWFGTQLRSVLATSVLFAFLFSLSGMLVVFTVVNKGEVKFSPPSVVERPRMSLKKPKVKIRKSSRPGFGNRDEVAINSELYSRIVDNAFLPVMESPLSTFSIDVDRASYANVRRFLNDNQLPPPDAVRIEEMINYFSYDYPQPQGDDPFSVSMEVADCPWNSEHQLALVGLQGRKIDTEDLPSNNLTFLLDVSGSMNNPDKLPLLKSAMRLLVAQLRPEDRVSIVVYAGAAGLVLEPTADNAEILAAIERLSAGGSTAGGAGIELAYKTAQQSFIKGGNNRVILATDGDFNVGVSSDSALTRLIEKKRKTGIFLTVLGFGTGNIKDSRMEQLADKGNGNYAYIDDILEAQKVLVTEMGGTLVTIAKDVKVQVEFNPAQVKAYRLIGYENRILASEDFADDKKDAGELGAGHTVTALYEIVPTDSNEPRSMTGHLRYQETKVVKSDELMNVKLRYKQPTGDASKLITQAVKASIVQAETPFENIRFASAVAEFGMLLRDSQYKGSANYNQLLRRARAAKGGDQEGYRAEFIRLVEKAELLD